MGIFKIAAKQLELNYLFYSGFTRKHHLHHLGIFSFLISVNPSVGFNQLKSMEWSDKKITFTPACES